MQITDVYIQNFLTVKEARLNLAERGLVLIQGVNEDDSSADSNGAGKSSIVDAICWCLYGVTARDVTGDAVINRNAKKSCLVTVEIEDNGKHYFIKRGRKSNLLNVDEIVPGGVVSLTGGTQDQTQATINRIVGCSKEVFMAAVYAGQEAMPDLPGMTDKELKNLIEEASGTSQLSAAYLLARSRNNALASQLPMLNSSVAESEKSVDRLLDELAKAVESADKYLLDVTEEVKTKKVSVINLVESAKALQKEIDSMNEAELNKRLAQLKVKGASFESQKKDLEILRAELDAHERNRYSISYCIEQKKSEITACEAMVSGVHKKVGQRCAECNKPYEAHDLASVKAHAEDTLRLYDGEMVVLLDELKKICDVITEKTVAIKAFEAAMLDPKEYFEQLSEINSDLKVIGSKKMLVAERNQFAKSALLELVAKSKKPNPYHPVMESAEKNLAAQQANSEDLRKRLVAVKTEQEMTEDATKIFGPAGLRAHILDTVTPFLNDRTAEYLGALSDGTISAVWSTLKPTATGELKEKFNIEVTSTVGGDSFKALSGGEKRKVRIACAMALQDLVATRATKPIYLFIADEVDHALDQSGLERLMTVLETKAKERGTVLVISHSDLKSWVDNIITVTKKDGESVVTGAARG